MSELICNSICTAGSGEMATVEVGPGGMFDVLAVPPGQSYFHANSYQRLQVPQLDEASSIHRLKRASEIPVRPL